MLQKTMKKCIPLATIADCESMGEIFFKAWRMAPEECREAIEFSIQDLMYNAVVAHRKPLGVIEGGVNKVAGCDYKVNSSPLSSEIIFTHISI